MKTRDWYFVVGIAALLVPVTLALVVFPTAMIDTRELFAWGRFLPLATHKHPPLMALIGGIVETVLPANAFSAILVGQILNAIGIAYFYATLVLVVDRERAAFFTFLYATCLYFQLAPLSYALNADILQVPIWLAVVYHFIRAAQTNRWGHWLALGAGAAAAVLTKYTAGLLFAAGAIATLVTPGVPQGLAQSTSRALRRSRYSTARAASDRASLESDRYWLRRTIRHDVRRWCIQSL